ncbi:NEL-type E3 ubiquitin ligase domain-containing protein [Pseudomonas sp. Rh2]|uniref:NEL-type E3 ubiquitin ligase domain-containing protein n=1 Tax=Pseudomonas sp. Rh2 TaxID=3112956 RepID=UPI00345D5B44
MEPGSGDFFGLLERLRETADFRQNGHALANRVFTMIRLMYGYTSLREDLLTHATETLTCQDSVALCFSNLELRMLVWQAQYAVEGQQRALLSLGRQLWRLDEVDRIALEDIRARKAAGGSRMRSKLLWHIALPCVMSLIYLHNLTICSSV